MGIRSDLHIDSRMAEVPRVRRWLGEYAKAEGFSSEEVRKLELVASEACVNVIEHAYGGLPSNPIDLSLAIDDESLVLEIRDVGSKIDLANYEPPDLSEPHEGGYGIYIMRSLMDRVEYDTSGEQGTTLTLTKRRPLPTP